MTIQTPAPPIAAIAFPPPLLLLLVLDTARAVPLAARTGRQPDTGEVKPLYGTLGVVAAHHVAV